MTSFPSKAQTKAPKEQMPKDFSFLETQSEFVGRHIGPSEIETKEMLKTLGFDTLDELTSKTIPKNILSEIVPPFESVSENEFLTQLKKTVSQNKVYHNLIGMGFHESITPTVIQRNVFENPAWYTAYTPYQAEISQGRMEALLNFQTMIMDLTGMEISNASLLDEGSAAAEAMFMAHNLTKKKNCNTILVSKQCHPHVIEVLRTRSAPLNIELMIVDENKILSQFQNSQLSKLDKEMNAFAMILQYPQSTGEVCDYKKLSDTLHAEGVFVIASVDLLALTILTPPGEWGADIVVGNSQRFGVPLGFGGPHAAFLATKDSFKRLMPGRLIGVSVDADHRPALRLALQTREQHIRREKATSNICTAQVLLANMASFYAVYHGPQGLLNIAERVHRYALALRKGLKKLGHEVVETPLFDTVQVTLSKVSGLSSMDILNFCDEHQINFRNMESNTFCISIQETTTLEILNKVLQIFNGNKDIDFSIASLDEKKWGVPIEWIRTSKYLTHSTFNSYHSETEMLRYITQLELKDLSLTHSMIPLGSCTMKLNATTELIPVSWPEISSMHPFAPLNQAKGYVELIKNIEQKLCDITGFAAVSVQPNAGSQGEYAGLLVIREYFATRGESNRNICLIPSSAHGTNPASAMLAGMSVVVVQCDENGNVDIQDLKAKATEHEKNLAALMITYPSTHGVFEEGIHEICETIHMKGGQVYMDGANLNALVGICYPGIFGPDVSHMNLHKTFSIPHGGGGPGVGPIGVKAHLAPFLPKHSVRPEILRTLGISSTTSAPWGSASILPISLAYISMMGGAGLRQATQMAILNANYVAKKLNPYFPVLYKGREGLVAHECIIDLRPLKKTSGIDVSDVAKRLMDYGFHAPTMSFPVVGTLMIEPTESESKAELDRFIEAMISIHNEIKMVEDKKWDLSDNPLVNAPHTQAMLLKTEWNHKYTREQAAYPLPWLRKNKFWPSVRRVDNAYGDRNIMCSCPSMEDYANLESGNAPS
jgi:glycine dehydrogenase